jgi:hypothetical protein
MVEDVLASWTNKVKICIVHTLRPNVFGVQQLLLQVLLESDPTMVDCLDPDHKVNKIVRTD